LIVDQGHRKRIQLILLHEGIGAQDYGVIDGVLLEEGGHFGRGIVFDRDSDESDALRTELVVELVEEWEFADAGDAVGSPEIDDDHFAGKGGRRKRAAFEERGLRIAASGIRRGLSLVEEGEELSGIAGESFEFGDQLFVGVEDHIVGLGDGVELFKLQLGVGLGGRVGAVGGKKEKEKEKYGEGGARWGGG